MIRRLNIKLEDFKIYETLKDFNKKFELNIKDIDIKELDLKYKVIKNKDFEFFKMISLSLI